MTPMPMAATTASPSDLLQNYLAAVARLSVPTLTQQQAETRAAAACLLLLGHPNPSEALAGFYGRPLEVQG